MKYGDLRDFVAIQEATGEFNHIRQGIGSYFEMTEICDGALRTQGPRCCSRSLKVRPTIPVLANLFGTPLRVALGTGEVSVDALREVDRFLTFLKEPDPPKGVKCAWKNLPILIPFLAARTPAGGPPCLV